MTTQEKRLTLELCKIKGYNKDLLTNLISKGHASPSVLGELFFNRMAGVAYKVLQESDLLGKVNREFRNSLSNAYLQNIGKNNSFFKCLEYVSTILSDFDSDYVMLKGAYLCLRYPAGCRTSNDIDLLVKPTSVGKIEEALLKEGFLQGNIKNGYFVPASRREIISSKMMRGETVPFIKEVNLPYQKYLEIDVNFSLGFAQDDGFAVNEMINNAQKIDLVKFCIKVPSEPDFFIHLCSHLWKEASTYPWIKMKRDMSIYKYSDIFLLMSSISLNSLEEIINRAKVFGLQNDCFATISQTKEIFKPTNVMYDILLDRFDSKENISNLVVYPEEKKLFEYVEKNVIKRLFSKDRCKLLKEVGEWKP